LSWFIGILIDRWIKRELFRLGWTESIGSTVDLIKDAWQVTSWEIYKLRFLGDPINKNRLIELLLEINSKFERILTLSAFWDFLDIIPNTNEVKGMFHEQFMEYLLAKGIISSTIENIYPFPDFLTHEIRPEINKIIRISWNFNKNEEIGRSLGNLWDVYQLHLGKTDVRSIAIRNHAIYYIGRLPDEKARDKLETANEVEKEIFVKLSIAFGLIKMGDYEMESRLYDNLKNYELWDKENRGYHLVYYGDWILKDDTPPYIDDGIKPWNRTFSSLLDHIESNEKQHIALRRIELLTIRRFIEVRIPLPPPAKHELKSIKKSVENMDDSPEGFKKAVESELIELEKLISTYSI
jgi:hypothetical protein